MAAFPPAESYACTYTIHPLASRGALRLNSRICAGATAGLLSSADEDLSDPSVWKAETDVLSRRAENIEAAQQREQRQVQKERMDLLGGLAMGAALLGAHWAAKQEVASAEVALGAFAGLSAVVGVLGATGVLGNWRGEDVEFRAEQQRRRDEERP